jgi:hypothetical protein
MSDSTSKALLLNMAEAWVRLDDKVEQRPERPTSVTDLIQGTVPT